MKQGKKEEQKTVQNKQSAVEDIQPVIDTTIVDIVFTIFDEVARLNALQDCFDNLADRLISDLKANSFMEFDLELKEDQKEQLRKAIKTKGNETVRDYLANVNSDERTKEVYGIVKEKTTAIVDAVLSAIGQEINRGAIINAEAVQANAKGADFDEILLRKTKESGDITIPTKCLLISTNAVAAIKASCQSEKDMDEQSNKNPEKRPAGRKSGKSLVAAAADRPAKPGK